MRSPERNERADRDERSRFSEIDRYIPVGGVSADTPNGAEDKDKEKEKEEKDDASKKQSDS